IATVCDGVGLRTTIPVIGYNSRFDVRTQSYGRFSAYRALPARRNRPSCTRDDVKLSGKSRILTSTAPSGATTLEFGTKKGVNIPMVCEGVWGSGGRFRR